MRYNKTPQTGDPSNIKQNFSTLQMNILSCHYWWLGIWKHENLSFPYWRIYWNDQPGATISFDNKKYELTPDQIIIIPPNTPFSTHYDPNGLASNNKDYFIGGALSTSKDAENTSLKHLFIHFKLGLNYDQITPQIFSVTTTPHTKYLIEDLRKMLTDEPETINWYYSVKIYSLITSLLYEIPMKEWTTTSQDSRILDTMRVIESDLSQSRSNEYLAKKVHLSTNALARLFKQEVGITLQQYQTKKRIEQSCVLLHHSSLTIDEVALECGFCDRHYFSRIFKKELKASPAAYRKAFFQQQ